MGVHLMGVYLMGVYLSRVPHALTTPRRSQRETAMSDDNVESYQLPSHQLELPVVLEQESVDLEPIPESVV
jgi:hypothetical protein